MVIKNFTKAREQMRKLHREKFGIRELKLTHPVGYKDDDDMLDNLNGMASRLANMEEEIAWMKNILSNMSV